MSMFGKNKTGNDYDQFQDDVEIYIEDSKTTNSRAAEHMEHELPVEAYAVEVMDQRERISLKDALAGYMDYGSNTEHDEFLDGSFDTFIPGFSVHLYLDEIQKWHLTEFKSQREQEGISAQTIKQDFKTIRKAVAWAKGNGYLAKSLKYPKVKKVKNYLSNLSLSDAKRSFKAIGPEQGTEFCPMLEYSKPEMAETTQDNQDLMVLMIDTGARYSEIVNIKWEEIDLEGKIINIWRDNLKTALIIYMTDRVYEMLRRRYNTRKNEYVFNN